MLITRDRLHEPVTLGDYYDITNKDEDKNVIELLMANLVFNKKSRRRYKNFRDFRTLIKNSELDTINAEQTSFPSIGHCSTIGIKCTADIRSNWARYLINMDIIKKVIKRLVNRLIYVKGE